MTRGAAVFMVEAFMVAIFAAAVFTTGTFLAGENFGGTEFCFSVGIIPGITDTEPAT
jgi:hypothetical protein